MVWSEIEEEENLDGLSEEQRETFRQRAVPVPGSLIRETVELKNDARRAIPSTLICTGYSAAQYQAALAEESGEHGDLSSGDPFWIVDPLDGTSNFACGFPLFAISLALIHGGNGMRTLVNDYATQPLTRSILKSMPVPVLMSH